MPPGTSLGQSEVPLVANNIGVTVISILPGYVGATDSQIEACFKKTAIKKVVKKVGNTKVGKKDVEKLNRTSFYAEKIINKITDALGVSFGLEE